MKDLAGRTAVITGAASGFGRELALLCAAERMRLSLADVDERGLQGTLDLLPPDTVATLQRCDVSRPDQVEAFAEQTAAQHGAAHLLFNNAGVFAAGPAWSATVEDWQWALGVNLMGVVHGIRSFVPRMIAHGQPAHVVNTASVAGLVTVPGSAVYCASKHAVVALSEVLHHDLRLYGHAIGVSVLCPAFVDTGIKDSERNRPMALAARDPLGEPFAAQLRKAVEAGKLSAADVARITLEAVKDDRFYVLTHPAIKPAIAARFDGIVGQREPAASVKAPRS